MRYHRLQRRLLRLKPAELRDALASVGEMATRFRTNVLIGSPVYRRGKLYNCLVVFNRQGAVVHCYAKCHLHELDRPHFTPGNAIALFEIDGVVPRRSSATSAATPSWSGWRSWPGRESSSTPMPEGKDHDRDGLLLSPQLDTATMNCTIFCLLAASLSPAAAEVPPHIARGHLLAAFAAQAPIRSWSTSPPSTARSFP